MARKILKMPKNNLMKKIIWRKLLRLYRLFLFKESSNKIIEKQFYNIYKIIFNLFLSNTSKNFKI
jgi:hypothetical protein